MSHNLAIKTTFGKRAFFMYCSILGRFLIILGLSFVGLLLMFNCTQMGLNSQYQTFYFVVSKGNFGILVKRMPRNVTIRYSSFSIISYWRILMKIFQGKILNKGSSCRCLLLLARLSPRVKKKILRRVRARRRRLDIANRNPYKKRINNGSLITSEKKVFLLFLLVIFMVILGPLNKSPGAKESLKKWQGYVRNSALGEPEKIAGQDTLITRPSRPITPVVKNNALIAKQTGLPQNALHNQNFRNFCTQSQNPENTPLWPQFREAVSVEKAKEDLIGLATAKDDLIGVGKDFSLVRWAKESCKKPPSIFASQNALNEQRAMIRLYPSPNIKVLGDKVYTTQILMSTYSVLLINGKLKAPGDNALAIAMAIYIAGETGRNIVLMTFMGSIKNFAKAYGLHKIDLSSLFPKDLWETFDKKTQDYYTNFDIKDITKFDEHWHMEVANKCLTYKLKIHTGVLVGQEKENNLSGNANPDFSLTFPDPRNPGKFITVYYDCKNINGEFRECNHLRPFPADKCLPETLGACKTQIWGLENKIDDLPDEEKLEGKVFLKELKSSESELQSAINSHTGGEEAMAKYNNFACTRGPWMHRNQITFNMTVKTDLQDFDIKPTLRTTFSELADRLATDPELGVRPFFESIPKDKNRPVTETSHFTALLEILKKIKLPDPEDGI